MILFKIIFKIIFEIIFNFISSLPLLNIISLCISVVLLLGMFILGFWADDGAIAILYLIALLIFGIMIVIEILLNLIPKGKLKILITIIYEIEWLIPALLAIAIIFESTKDVRLLWSGILLFSLFKMFVPIKMINSKHINKQ
jgi:hypothetical protein